MISCSFNNGVFVKARIYGHQITWNIEFYVPLLLKTKQSKTKDLAFTRIKLLLWIQ